MEPDLKSGKTRLEINNNPDLDRTSTSFIFLKTKHKPAEQQRNRTRQHSTTHNDKIDTTTNTSQHSQRNNKKLSDTVIVTAYGQATPNRPVTEWGRTTTHDDLPQINTTPDLDVITVAQQKAPPPDKIENAATQ